MYHPREAWNVPAAPDFLKSSKILPSAQEDAAKQLLERLLPRHRDSFTLEVEPHASEGTGSFELLDVASADRDKAPQIRIRGTSGVDVAAGLHWYLKHLAGAHISWDKSGGPQLGTLHKGPLPPVGSPIRKQRPTKWSYYQNVCTVSYSMAWWDWARWEKEIDWMALQGINLPLAFTGQEAIWQKVYQRPPFNFTKAELDDFFGGPAFLAWARMSNIHRWGGPLPQAWLDGQLALQKKILARMRSLGMTPVLPGFAGGVPPVLKDRFPNAKIRRLGNWGSVAGNPSICCNHVLDGSDPLFVQIGQVFVAAQIEEYGTDHIYNCDTFNENAPPSLAPEYIAAIGRSTFEGMHGADHEAVWLMQGWLFYNDPEWQPPQMKALLHSVPLGRLVVLDLYADVHPVWERTSHFYGVPYIWCMLHNFGGNLEMYGDLSAITTGPLAALGAPNSTLVGIGMTPEGIEQNPVVYELMAEMAYRDEAPDLEEWVASYAARRYGVSLPAVTEAWEILRTTVYASTDKHNNHNLDSIAWFQTADGAMPGSSGRFGSHMWYHPRHLLHAWELLLSASDHLTNSSTYLYDLADVTRQVLSKHSNDVFDAMLVAYEGGSIPVGDERGETLLQLIADMEEVLGTRQELLLGPWLAEARAWGKTEAEANLMEWNARTQLTMWLDSTRNIPSTLHDYANKEWSGLVGGYYLPRMALYVEMLKEAATNGHFPYSKFWRAWVGLTRSFQESTAPFPVVPQGNTIQVSAKLYAKYKDEVSDELFLKKPANLYFGGF